LFIFLILKLLIQLIQFAFSKIRGIVLITADKIKKHQEELAEKLARDRRKGADEDSTSAGPSTAKPYSKDIVAYPDTSVYPSEAHRNKVKDAKE
jgi:hypothetical protein